MCVKYTHTHTKMTNQRINEESISIKICTRKKINFFPKKMGTVNGKLLKGIKYDNKSKIPSLIY